VGRSQPGLAGAFRRAAMRSGPPARRASVARSPWFRQPASRRARCRREAATARRLQRVSAVSASAFLIGGSLFAIGAALAQSGVGARAGSSRFLVGGAFFSTGGFASLLQVVNDPCGVGPGGALTGRPWHWWAYEPERLEWASTGSPVRFGRALAAYAQLRKKLRKLPQPRLECWPSQRQLPKPRHLHPQRPAPAQRPVHIGLQRPRPAKGWRGGDSGRRERFIPNEVGFRTGSPDKARHGYWPFLFEARDFEEPWALINPRRVSLRREAEAPVWNPGVERHVLPLAVPFAWFRRDRKRVTDAAVGAVRDHLRVAPFSTKADASNKCAKPRTDNTRPVVAAPGQVNMANPARRVEDNRDRAKLAERSLYSPPRDFPSAAIFDACAGSFGEQRDRASAMFAQFPAYRELIAVASLKRELHSRGCGRFFWGGSSNNGVGCVRRRAYQERN
jgi:hypothetical protein